jgi:hypothetical protein
VAAPSDLNGADSVETRAYCEQAIEVLLSDALAKSLPGSVDLQRGVVLAYLAQLRLSEGEFLKELQRLRLRASCEHNADLAAAARAIRRDWEARAARDG